MNFFLFDRAFSWNHALYHIFSKKCEHTHHHMLAALTSEELAIAASM